MELVIQGEISTEYEILQKKKFWEKKSHTNDSTFEIDATKKRHIHTHTPLHTFTRTRDP